MNPDKAKLKMMMANEFGADLEDRLEGERKAANELAGGAHALRQASKKVPNDLLPFVEKDLTEKIITDSMEAHLVAQLIKKYLTRVGDFLNHLADVEQQKAVAQGGRVDGMATAMGLIKKVRDTETLKLQQFLALAEQAETTDGDLELRTAGAIARAEHGSAADRKEQELNSVLILPAVEETSKKQTPRKKIKKAS